LSRRSPTRVNFGNAARARLGWRLWVDRRDALRRFAESAAKRPIDYAMYLAKKGGKDTWAICPTDLALADMDLTTRG
jgi:hypothetical protein